MLNAADLTATDLTTRAVVRTLAATGLRRSELVALLWSDLTFSTGPGPGAVDTLAISIAKATTLTATGHLRTAKPKTRNATRTITVQGKTVQTLLTLRAQARTQALATGIPLSHVFTNPQTGTQLRPDLAGDLVTRCARDVGLGHLTAHDIRHTHGTRLKVRGIASDASFDLIGDRDPVRDLGSRVLRAIVGG